ncbi:MAG: sigma 54-interacting transcriptional regulator [Bdellovibrionota bacterium]
MSKTQTKIIRADEQPTLLTLPKSKLVVMQDDVATKEYSMSKGTITIGSSSKSDLILSDDTVSRNHAEIKKTKDGYLLRDLESTNGTFLGNVKVREVFLGSNANIRVGRTKIKFISEDERLEIYPSKKSKFGDMIGQSIEMRKIFGVLEKVAPTNVTVVIGGETGTGKELVAKAVHEHSKRAKRPFIIFDCGAVAENLIESELFGHEKGSFTGATTTRQGAFELADEGTIFLDEIGELSLDLQPKLLRVLETGEVKRVGADRAKKVNVRVVAATHRNLKEMVKQNLFREDLFFRLSVVQILLPPLRKRRDDVETLIKHFFELSKKENHIGENVDGISDEAKRLLMEYQWPGNIRELKNAMDRAMSFCDGSQIEIQHLPEYLRDTPTTSAATSLPSFDEDLPFKEAKEKWVETFEKDYLINILRKNDMNISKAAKEAGIDRKSVQRLLKKYDLNVKDL